VAAWRNAGFVGAALVLHALVVALLPYARRAPRARKADERLTEIEVEAPATAGPAGRSTGRAPLRRAAESVPGAVRATATGTATGTATATATDNGPTPSPDSSAAPLPSILTTDTDIGLDGPGSFRVEVAKQQPDENARVAENVRRSIMDPIHEHELRGGDVTSGPVARELELTTRRLDGTPFEGRAVFAIDVDELGLVVGVNVSESSGDRRAWNDVARKVLNAFAQKRLPVAHGAHHVAMRIEVSSRVTMPSGSRHPLTVGSPAVEGLAHAAQGQFDRPAETPAIVGGSFDLSDIGAHPLRVVAARVLSQQAY
jgi:hypothetical protein